MIIICYVSFILFSIIEGFVKQLIKQTLFIIYCFLMTYSSNLHEVLPITPNQIQIQIINLKKLTF